jgi:hypothetical protein
MRVKAWFRNIGDTQVSIFTPVNWYRPEEIGFEVTGVQEQRTDFYTVTWSDNVPTVTRLPQATIDSILADEQAIRDAIQARRTAVEEAKATEGVSKYTPDQVRDYIDNQIDNAGTAAQKVEAIKKILKKLAVYVLEA